MQPQPGIFAQGTGEHCYVEFDLLAGADPLELVTGLAALHGPAATVADVNVVVAVRPELWARLRPDAAPAEVSSFQPIQGPEVTFPATQHDAWLWVAGGSRDAVFDATLAAILAVAGCASVATEVGGWHYRHDRDLTGFIDGTENPSTIEAYPAAIHAEGPGQGCSVVLVQLWSHARQWATLAVDEQERVIGRSKVDSVELAEDVMPSDSHVARTVVEENGAELQIYRRNTAYGGPSEHGTSSSASAPPAIHCRSCSNGWRASATVFVTRSPATPPPARGPTTSRRQSTHSPPTWPTRATADARSAEGLGLSGERIAGPVQPGHAPVRVAVHAQ